MVTPASAANMVAPSSEDPGGRRQLDSSILSNVPDIPTCNASTAPICDEVMEEFNVTGAQFVRGSPRSSYDKVINAPPNSNRPKSFSEAVSRTADLNPKARFDQVCPSSNEKSAEHGKSPSASLASFSVVPNLEMLNEISKEKSRLSNTAIFFSVTELDKCPPRKFMDDWFHNFWNNKLGFHISFCRKLQKGLYVIFFANSDAQKEVLKRQYWVVGSTSFRALAWSPEVAHEEVLALAAPRWILVKNVPPFLWKFLPQLMEPLGKTIRMDDSVRLVPHMDARMLISLLPGIEVPENISVNILNESFVCPLEVLGGLNACFLCRKEGHRRKDCPIIKKNLVNSHNVANVNPPEKNNKDSAGAKISPPYKDDCSTKANRSSNPTSVSKNLDPIALSVPPANGVAHPKDALIQNLRVVPPPLGSHLSPVENSGIDLNSDDGFIVVQEKKKRKGLHISRQEKVASGSVKRFVPNSHQVVSPTIGRQDKLPGDIDLNSISQSGVACVRSPPNNVGKKLPQKVFKEIEDEYVLEIIPAGASLDGSTVLPSMEVDAQVINKDVDAYSNSNKVSL